MKGEKMGLRTTLDGFYERASYMFGGGWISYESGVQPGTVRVINGILSQAWQVRKRRWRKDEILWAPVKPKELREVDINERPD
jgi:hypothetical protein